MSDLIGQQVGRYQVLELLGEGGMATVYKAHDPRLERDVAIKVIRRDAFPPEDLDMLLKRFEREAKALGKLSHPNIVGVIDYGEHEGSPYLVMVYVGGGTLKDRLGYPLPPMKWRDAVRMLLPIARALEYVHERGIINRDVKPYALMAGVPARQIGWMSEHGERLDLPLEGNGSARCPATGTRYVMQDGAVSKEA